MHIIASCYFAHATQNREKQHTSLGKVFRMAAEKTHLASEVVGVIIEMFCIVILYFVKR